MEKANVFKNIENMTYYKPQYTISASCDENGEYEIYILGKGGTEVALKSLRETMLAITDEDLNKVGKSNCKNGILEVLETINDDWILNQIYRFIINMSK